MKLTEAFLGEHGVLYALLDHLQEAVPTAEALDLVKGQAALLTAALLTHANLEDELLFTALDPHLGQMGPLAVMRMEHEEIEGALARASQVKDVTEAKALVLRAVEVARGHFSKEEHILFRMAEQVLDAGVLAELGQKWAERRKVVI